jgi:hypothetical protein
MDHDVYSCECHETCSLCVEPTPITQLKPMKVRERGIVVDTWEQVCPKCRREEREQQSSYHY